MHWTLDAARKFILLGALGLSVSSSFGTGHAKDDTILYTFQDSPDGAGPSGALLTDKSGNLYGETGGGGNKGYGTVFKLTPSGIETVLYSFNGKPHDGGYPDGGLISDASGSLYGTTGEGGRKCSKIKRGCGVVFELTSNDSESILHMFEGADDGADPIAGLIEDQSGNLFGTTQLGGGNGCNGKVGCGTVFKLSPDGSESVFHAFEGGSDGQNPGSGLILDGSGNLYGTTPYGGSGNCYLGCGIVFELAPDGTETILHDFAGGTDGVNPHAALISDGSGNLYGTTYSGGKACSGDDNGCGTVFKLAPNGDETVLYAFKGGRDGFTPFGGLIIDAFGNLYGTTEFGGNKLCSPWVGCGIAFRIAPDGTETILHVFTGGSDGAQPVSPLLLDKKGNLYGVTAIGGGAGCGGAGCGTVFELKQ